MTIREDRVVVRTNPGFNSPFRAPMSVNETRSQVQRRINGRNEGIVRTTLRGDDVPYTSNAGLLTVEGD
ncbi:hypothetical protein BOTBODRAFT_406282 [Botryobasidium botryosum FD-172 SS1]|uniref:Uncharacterized protein n=1 Tax=Botryobasidium botryosum (strain FD-172 SS1) TaxID=930990 RepID=A0A067MBL7_BOTB1|nr:hypothetical protein BOTBODRAFT_406282 [Botryobasidium botryosum FD-172 SS1]